MLRNESMNDLRGIFIEMIVCLRVCVLFLTLSCLRRKKSKERISFFPVILPCYAFPSEYLHTAKGSNTSCPWLLYSGFFLLLYIPFFIALGWIYFSLRRTLMGLKGKECLRSCYSNSSVNCFGVTRVIHRNLFLQLQNAGPSSRFCFGLHFFLDCIFFFSSSPANRLAKDPQSIRTVIGIQIHSTS